MLIHVLEQGYAGFINEARTPKQELVKNLTLLSNEITDTIQAKEFAKRIDDIFFKFPDGHLLVRSFKDDLSRQRVLGRKLPTVGSNIGEGKVTTHCYFYEERKINGKQIGIIGIPNRFLPPSDPCWNGFESTVERAKNLHALILDLRGNTGGNDTKGYELAKILAGREIETPKGFIRQIWLKTLVALDLHLNTQKWITSYAPTQGWPVQGYLDSLRDAERLTQQRIDTKNFEPEVSDGPQFFKVPSDEKRKIFVLVDAKCGSSCESSLEALLTIPETKTIGENTVGHRHFTNVGTYLLPNSRINISIPTKYNQYDEFLENIGHSPDIRCEGEDALTVALRNI